MLNPRIAGGLALAAAGTAVGLWLVSPRSLEVQLAAASDGSSAPTQVWYFFRSADCKTGSTRFDTLNAVARAPGVNLRAVMLDAPPDSMLAMQLAKQFGAEFSVVPDLSGKWSNVLSHAKLTPPFFAQHVHSGVTIVRHPKAIERLLVALIPAADLSLRKRSTTSLRDRRTIVPLTPTLEWTVPAAGGHRSAGELLSIRDSLIVIFDYADMALKAYSADGVEQWKQQDAGSGSVFMTPFDLQSSETGFELLDGGSGRVYTISPSGHIVRNRRVPSGTVRAASVRNHSIAAVVELSDASYIAVVDSAGRVIRRIQAPEALAQTHYLARESFVTTLPGSDTIVQVFRRHGAFRLGDVRKGHLAMLPGADSIPFPFAMSWRSHKGVVITRLDPAAPEAARRVAALGSRLFILSSGINRKAGRVIDVYDRNTVGYQGSFLLPKEGTALAALGQDLVVLHPGHAGTVVARYPHVTSGR